MKTKCDIDKLPKWAQQIISNKQELINKLRCENSRMQKQLNDAELANKIIDNGSWTILGLHEKEPRKLFILNKDSFVCVATISPEHVLLVGSKKK